MKLKLKKVHQEPLNYYYSEKLILAASGVILKSDSSQLLVFLQLLRLVKFTVEDGAKIGFPPRTPKPGKHHKRERVASQTTDSALRWLGRVRDHPFFLWVHYFYPHSTYEPPAPYDKMHDSVLQRS